jgi:streptogramin lyase
MGHDYPLYATDSTSGNVYEVGSNGAVSVFASGFAHPTAITYGSDGYIYVGQENGDIYRINQGGTVSPYYTSHGGSVRGLAFDAGGNLFIGDQYSGYVDQLTTALVRTHFAAVGTIAQGLAFDTSGDLYVATGGWGDNRILRIDPSGGVHPFAALEQNPVALNFDLAGFPDGYLLSSENQDGLTPTVIKIDSQGTVTQRAPFSGSGINGICVANDGYIYATHLDAILKLDSSLNTVSTITFPGAQFSYITTTPEPVPEPISLASGAIGLACLAYFRRRMK